MNSSIADQFSSIFGGSDVNKSVEVSKTPPTFMESLDSNVFAAFGQGITIVTSSTDRPLGGDEDEYSGYPDSYYHYDNNSDYTHRDGVIDEEATYYEESDDTQYTGYSTTMIQEDVPNSFHNIGTNLFPKCKRHYARSSAWEDESDDFKSEDNNSVSHMALDNIGHGVNRGNPLLIRESGSDLFTPVGSDSFTPFLNDHLHDRSSPALVNELSQYSLDETESSGGKSVMSKHPTSERDFDRRSPFMDYDSIIIRGNPLDPYDPFFYDYDARENAASHLYRSAKNRACKYSALALNYVGKACRRIVLPMHDCFYRHLELYTAYSPHVDNVC